MTEITFNLSFKRAFKKYVRNRASSEATFWKAVEIFASMNCNSMPALVFLIVLSSDAAPKIILRSHRLFVMFW